MGDPAKRAGLARQAPPAPANDDARRPPLTDAQRRLAAVLADMLYRDLRANPPPR